MVRRLSSPIQLLKTNISSKMITPAIQEKFAWNMAARMKMISSPEIQEPSVSGFCMRQNYFAAGQMAWTIAIIVGKIATKALLNLIFRVGVAFLQVFVWRHSGYYRC
ncbi:MAG: hypothetical protein IH598_16335 [Bacteroidales bacterium]|nr:hypothetical protein [Bacteroidales bacterium]